MYIFAIAILVIAWSPYPQWETFQTAFSDSPGNEFLEMTGMTDEGTGIFNVELRFKLFLRREADSTEIDTALVQLKILLVRNFL